MIVRDPWNVERDAPRHNPPGSLWVNLDAPKRFPFGFGVHAPAPVEKKRAKKRKKSKQ